MQESVRALMCVAEAIADHNDQMTKRGLNLVTDLVVGAFENYFLSMDETLRKEVLRSLALIHEDTPLSSSFKKKLQASCTWDDPALVEVLAGRGNDAFIEDAEIVQYRVTTLLNQDRHQETENYAKHFKLPFVVAQMQAM